MSKLGTDSVGDAISSSLKRYMSEGELRELYIGEAEAHVLLKLIGQIGSESDALLVTTDPFDDYRVSAMSFGRVATLICSMLTRSLDVRVFGPSWAIGLSSYRSNAQNDSDDEIPAGELEIKVSLVGSALAWLPHRG
jgi:hypothetical protein